jgi:hypothetical protein
MSEARKEHHQTTETTQKTTDTVDAAATAANPDAASVTGSAVVDEAIATQAERTATAGKVTVEQEK